MSTHPAINVGRKPLENLIQYTKKNGENWRLKTPKSPKVSPTGFLRKKMAEETKELVNLTRQRHKRQFEEEYQLKKAEYQKQLREEAARKEQQRRAAQRKHEYYQNVMSEYIRLKDKREVLNIQYNREKDEMKARARKEWLRVMNEDCDLWNNSPEDLKFRRFDIRNTHFFSKLPADHSYVLNL